MTVRPNLLCAAMLATSAMFASIPAQALTMQECSAKYKAAKTAGTLGTQKWNDFRKAQCLDGVAAAKADAKATAAKSDSASKEPAKPAVFPTAIAPKYSSDKAAKGRMHTCVDQYKANKTTNANGGMKWVEKGGGYFSECNKRLKG
jgi:hypothetical protein